MQHRISESAKSVTGAAFIGLGVFVLHEHLARATGQFSHLFGSPGNALGILPRLVLAALRVLQAYASDRHRFLLSFMAHALQTLWPLLLVIAGTALSRDRSKQNVGTTVKKDRSAVDLSARRSTLR